MIPLGLVTTVIIKDDGFACFAWRHRLICPLSNKLPCFDSEMLLKCQYNVDAHFYVLGGKFQCAVCNMSFKNSGSLTNHRKRRHPDEGQARIVHGKMQRAAIAKAKAISNANFVSKLFLKPFNLTEYQVRRLPHKIYCKNKIAFQ